MSPVNPPRPTVPAPAAPPWWSLVLVAIAFGIIEASVVTLYRTQLDPQGRFPLLPLPPGLAGLERLREAATLVLLGSVAMVACRATASRVATFFFLFGAWDLTYYVTLRATLGWPRGLSDWDLLFLLPVPWFAPVYAPLLVACILILVGTLVLRHETRYGPFRVHGLHVLAALVGALVCVWSFVESTGARSLVALPGRYAVEWLGLGLAVGGAAFVDALRRNRRSQARAAAVGTAPRGDAAPQAATRSQR